MMSSVFLQEKALYITSPEMTRSWWASSRFSMSVFEVADSKAVVVKDESLG